jgi:putative acetyltransferase
MLVLRPSTAGDVDAMFRIWESAVRATRHFLSEDDIAFFAPIVRKQYLPSSSFTVAEVEGRIVAFMGMTGAKIDALFVDPVIHGKGVGRRLVEHARHGRDVLEVDVNEANAGARAFYARMGFLETGRSPVDGMGKPFPIVRLNWARLGCSHNE